VEDKVEKTDEDGIEKAVVAAEAVAEATQPPAIASSSPSPATPSTPVSPAASPVSELGEGKGEKEEKKNSLEAEQGTFDK
jgi:hypothetical protein